jgi:hypothetical protein
MVEDKRSGVRVLGISCFIITLGLLMATAISAHAKGHWFVVLTHTLTVGAKEEGNDFQLLATFGVGETPIGVLCSKIKIDNGLLFADGSGSGELLLSSCQTLISGLVKANCKLLEPATVKVKSLLLHHSNDTYILFSPTSGAIFTTLHLGELCAPGEEVEVTGQAVAECGVLLEASWDHEDCSAENVTHEIRQASAELFTEHKLNFGSKAATLDGDASLSLTGIYAGMNWGALATL